MSPDRTRVAFISFMTGNADVWVQNVDGSGLRRLTDDDTAEVWSVWSPDGRAIVFGKSGSIWRVAADGGTPEKLFDGGSAATGSRSRTDRGP